MTSQGIPLELLGLAKDLCRRLRRERGITTVEALYEALIKIENAPETIMALLELDRGALEELIQIAQGLIGDEDLAQLEKETEFPYALGALPEEDEDEKGSSKGSSDSEEES